MSPFNKSYIVIIGILSLSLLLVMKVEGSKKILSSGAPLETIPFYIGDWKGKDLEISKDVYEVLETKDIVMREYKDSQGVPVWLAIIYSKDNPDSFHPPEICYVGGGVKLINKKKEKIKLNENEYLTLNKLTMQTPSGIVKAWYWFVAGDKFMDSYYLQQFYLIWNTLINRETSGALIRVSIAGNSEVLEEKAKLFIKEVVPYIRKIFKKGLLIMKIDSKIKNFS
ncbi:MAG: EpsI family protein [Candidatus Omnitrophota bacterium]|nr:MAG: EpsI family protein [Candidatus Omnitrophota bacterium]